MADRSVTVLLRASVSDYVAKMSAAGKATQDLALKVEAAKAKTAAGYRAIGVGAVAMGGAVALGVGVAAKAAADFDAKMALVQTLLKAAPADMAKMRVAALSVGQAYGYTAGQVADAQAELAKAGIGVKEQLGGALVGALTLAAAGQTDVATATTIAATAMTQFQLKGKDVPHIADLLAAGADRALGSVQDLGEGLNQAGSQAHIYGVSLEDTVGTLAALAQAGQVGSRGGTELSQMLMKLSAPSKKAADDLATLKINTYDASGQFVGLVNLSGQLHDKLGPLTQATRNQYLAQIFGARAVKAANVLYQLGADGLQKWIDRTNVAGFAALQSSGKLNSLSGDWLKFKAAIGAASIEAGQPAQGPLRTLVQDATKATEAWRGLPGPVRDSAEALVVVGGAITLVGGAALIMIPKIAATNAALTDMGLSAITARSALTGIGKAGLVGAVVFGVYEGAKALGSALANDTTPSVNEFTTSLIRLQATADGTTNSLLTEMSGIGKMGNPFGLATKMTANLDTALGNLVTSGHLADAEDDFARISAALRAGGMSTADITKLFPQLSAALTSSANSAALAGDGIDQYGNAVSAAAKKTQNATAAAKAYNDALHAAADPLFAMNQALQDIKSKQDAYTKAVQKHGAASKAARQADLELASTALSAQADARTLAAAVTSGTVSIAGAKDMLHAWVKAGILTKSQADAITGSFKGIIDKGEALNRLRPHISVSADTSPAMLALDQVASKIGSLVGHTWQAVVHASVFGPPKTPGRASGGGAPDGFFAVGEQGPELAFKDGSNVHIFSNSASRAMVGATGMSVPGFAGGTTASQRYEKRLRSIISDRGASPHDIRKAVEALTALSAAWDATLKRIGNREQLHGLQHAVAAAQTPSERAQAEKQLEQFRRQRDQDHRTAQIQKAQDLATNRQTWLFERMSVTEQIHYLDKAMDKEKRFSDQWLQDAEQRRSLRQSQKQDLAGNKAAWAFEHMNAQQQIAYLDKKIAKEKRYSDQWLSDSEQREQILASMSDATTTPGSNPTYTTAINVPDMMLGATYSPWVPSRSGVEVHVHMEGPVAGDWQALAKKIAQPVRQELAKYADAIGPV